MNKLMTKVLWQNKYISKRDFILFMSKYQLPQILLCQFFELDDSNENN